VRIRAVVLFFFMALLVSIAFLAGSYYLLVPVEVAPPIAIRVLKPPLIMVEPEQLVTFKWVYVDIIVKIRNPFVLAIRGNLTLIADYYRQEHLMWKFIRSFTLIILYDLIIQPMETVLLRIPIMFMESGYYVLKAEFLYRSD